MLGFPDLDRIQNLEIPNFSAILEPSDKVRATRILIHCPEGNTIKHI